MRRGCIAVAKMHCDGCHALIDHGERYLVIEEEAGKERRLCVTCCLNLGYAYHKEEEGEETITFFSREDI